MEQTFADLIAAAEAKDRSSNGQTKNRCSARRTNGQPCRLPPINGGTVCRMHGGSAPQVKRAAALRLQRDAVEREWAKLALGDVVPTDPTQALLESVSWAAAMVRWLRTLLAEVGVDDVAWGKVKAVRKDSGMAPGVDVTSEARQNIVLTMVGEWTDRLGRLAALAIKAGVEQRQIELAERLGELVLLAFEGMLVEVGLDTETEARARASLGRQLVLLSGEGGNDGS